VQLSLHIGAVARTPGALADLIIRHDKKRLYARAEPPTAALPAPLRRGADALARAAGRAPEPLDGGARGELAGPARSAGGGRRRDRRAVGACHRRRRLGVTASLLPACAARPREHAPQDRERDGRAPEVGRTGLFSRSAA
jgi:hypothetical protein